MTDQKVNRFLIPIAVIVVIFSIFKTIKNDKKEEQLKLENNYVIGEITDHKVTGLAETYHIYYKYSVDGTEYSKSVNYSFKYSDCQRTKNCIGVKHPVYYDIENPNNAFMDFNSTELDLKKLNIQKKRFKERIDN
ncbi:hypothetical protein H3Z83_11790 [Tenacibaculum sp. S7007]|uniref:DUF3592 domain-containing protein n=1 Tax=Tenacibaculum pelagium TaxID=2759527 RepID=A0A839AQ36_9FLAO|nr:hypothetical protein [Tenacibaculum pelagium]MBA6157195.1 hypothetical protein [Tenacibaculum pelagium]